MADRAESIASDSSPSKWKAACLRNGRVTAPMGGDSTSETPSSHVGLNRGGEYQQPKGRSSFGSPLLSDEDDDSLPDLDELLKAEYKPKPACKSSKIAPASKDGVSNRSSPAAKSQAFASITARSFSSSAQASRSEASSPPDTGNATKKTSIMSLAPAYRKRVKSTPTAARTELSSRATIETPTTGSIPLHHLSSQHQTPRIVPDWYSSTSSTDPRLRSSSITLRRLKTLHQSYQQNFNKPSCPPLEVHAAEAALCSFIHSLSLFDFQGKEKAVIKKSFLLTDPDIFPPLLADSPPHIFHPAQHLYKRWWAGDTDPNLLRGIIRTRSKSSKTGNMLMHYGLEPKYNFRISPKYIGHGDLYIGQWWPLQICANRDGAHGEIEAGVYGVKGMGALSIVLSGGGYSDIDLGDEIYYCGTPSPTTSSNFPIPTPLTSSSATTPDPSVSTALLLESQAKTQEIRVLRSSKSPEKKWAPVRGIRYDGLYTITDSEVIERETGLWRFRMVRKEGQEGICCAERALGAKEEESGGVWRDGGRGGGTGSEIEVLEDLRARPHPVEIEALKRDERLRKFEV